MLDTVLITGGSRGIGAELTRAFSRIGKRVAFVYFRSKNEALALADETGAYPICADLSKACDVSSAYSSAKSALKHVDILINNAGISRIAPIQCLSDDEYFNMININQNAAYLMSKAALPDMISKKSGRIINISSIWGLVGASCETAYSSTKAALIGLTKALAKEVAPCGITVNAIAPGVFETDMNAVFTDDERDQIIAEIPMGRMGVPADIASLAVFLASEQAAYITAQVVGVGGGYGE